MEGGRSGRILRNKRGRTLKAAGCGDKPRRREMRGGWMTAELLEGAGFKGC